MSSNESSKLCEDKEMEMETLPVGWKKVKLEEILKYEQPQKYLVKSEKYDEKSGIPVLTTGKSFILGYTDENDGIYIDIPAIIFDDFTTDSRYINFNFKLKSSAIKILKIKNNDNNLFFIYNIMQIVNFNPGSEHKRYWISEYSKIFVYLPPLPEQQKISEILETVDNAIEKTDKIIEKYKRIKQGLMQDLLTRGIDENGQIRSEETHKFKDSPLGRIPEEWEVVKLGDKIYLNPEKLEYKKNKIINYIDIESVINGKIQAIKIFKVEESPSRAQRLVKSNDVIVSTVRPNLKAFTFITSNYNNYVCSTGFAVFRSKKEIDPLFLFYLILYDGIFLIQILPLIVGSNYPAVNSYELLNLKIPHPPFPEQQRIASILSQVDETIDKEENYKEKLERIKQGLMEDLLTGKVRVNHLIEKTNEE